MRALLLSEYQNLNVVEVEKPRLGPKDVLVSVKACGICGSDVHGYDGSSGRRIPPLVMGHEAAGLVTEIGAEVSRFSIGQRVTFDSMISCGNCPLCSKGSTNLCADRRVLGVSCETYRQSGCFAEFVSVPEHIVYEIPDDLSFEHAALVEPVSVAVHAVSLLDVPSGASAVVVGTGMIGLLVVQALRVAGCEQIVAIDIDPFKLNLAKELGATHCIRVADEDVATEVLAITEGVGVDIAMEVVGKTEPLRTAIDCVRLGGQVGLVGNLQPDVNLPLQKVVTRELKLIGSCGSSGEYQRCIELMASGEIKVSPLISQITNLNRGAEFFQRLYEHEPELLKVVIQP